MWQFRIIALCQVTIVSEAADFPSLVNISSHQSGYLSS